MLFHTVASVALLAAAAHAAADEVKRQPYRLAVMALPGQSLMRRTTYGYNPDQQKCKAGNSCAEACGAGFAQCAGGTTDVAHCFNPGAGETCCTDGSGNSCEAGYYCTHDSKQTWCCPGTLDLAACAAAYHVSGMVAATSSPSTSTTSPSTSRALTTTSISLAVSSSSSSSSSSSTTTTTTTAKTSTLGSSSGPPSTTSLPVLTAIGAQNTTTIGTASTGQTTTRVGFNSTIASPLPTQPQVSASTVTVVPPSSTASPPRASSTSANDAAASGVSAILLVAAGVVALL